MQKRLIFVGLCVMVFVIVLYHGLNTIDASCCSLTWPEYLISRLATTNNTNTTLAASPHRSHETEPLLEEDNIDAISKSDGQLASTSTLFNVSQPPSHIYILYAFYDDRWQEHVSASLAVMAILEQPDVDPDAYYCFVDCDSGKFCTEHQVSSGLLKQSGVIHKVWSFNNKTYFRNIIRCSLDAACKAPIYVTVTYDKIQCQHMIEVNDSLPMPSFKTQQDRSMSRVAIEYPRKKLEHEFGVCIPPIYGCLDPIRLVEWFELQQLLGVTKFILFNNSLCEISSRVIRHYVELGLAEVTDVQETFPDHSPNASVFHRSRAIGTLRPVLLNRCLYRHMYTLKYMLLSDLDEVIVPRIDYTYHDLMARIKSNHSGLISSIYFKNYYFLINEKLDEQSLDSSKPAFATLLRSRHRLGASQKHAHVKSIFNPLGCGSVSNHLCLTRIGKYSPGSPEHVQMSSDLAHNQHYRHTACRMIGTSLVCKDKANGTVIYQDDTMLRYEKELIPRVANKLKMLEITSN